MDRLRGEPALWLAWLLAFTASLAVLFIGEVLGQTPCSLCWFQRAFMFPLAFLLGLGLWWRELTVGRYGVALALAGAAVALWHLALYAGLIPERIQTCAATGPSCTDANQLILGVPIPALALLSFLIIAALCDSAEKVSPHDPQTAHPLDPRAGARPLRGRRMVRLSSGRTGRDRASAGGRGAGAAMVAGAGA